VGHDKRGIVVYRKNQQGDVLLDENEQPIIWNDLPTILQEWNNYIVGLPIKNINNPSCFIIDSSQIREDKLHRMDAWYHDPNKNLIAKKMMDYVGDDIQEIQTLGDVTIKNGIFYPGRHKRNYVPRSQDSLPFYSSSQILQVRDFNLKYQPKSYRPAKNHIVKKDWILITRSGTTGRVMIVNEYMNDSMVSEHAIRVIIDESKIDPYYVYAFLSTDGIGRTLLSKGIYASVVDEITPDFVSTIPIPRLDPKSEKKIADSVRNAESKRSYANKTLRENMDFIQQFMFSTLGIDDPDIELVDE
jgi:hypothetical protein